MSRSRTGENALDLYDGGRDETLRTFRTYAIIAGSLIPFFWVVYRWTDPGVVDPFWLRLVMSGAAFALIGASVVSRWAARHFVVLMHGYLYVVTAWFVGLTAVNAFSPNYAVGLLFVIAAIAVAIGTSLQRTRPLTVYLVLAVLGTTVVMLATPTTPAGEISRFIFLGCVASISLVVHVAASATIRAQARLRVSERKYRTLFSAANDAILLIEPESGRIVEANQGALELYGFGADELVGSAAAAIGGAGWLDGVPYTNREAEHRCRNGSTAHLLVSTTKIDVDDRPMILSINRDVTERLQTLESLSDANEALRQRNRDLQDFGTAASHDLQEPVRKMHLFVDLMQQEFGSALDAKGIDYLKRLQGIALQMSSIVADLLAFSRVTAESRPTSETNLTLLVREVVAEFGAEIDELTTQIHVGELPTVHAQPLQMRTLLRRLISNALDARRSDGVLKISIEGWSKDGRCGFTVADNGVGIEEKYHEQVFSPFRQLKSPRPRGRTGMGLAICKRIVEHHGGEITLESRPGEGSTFRVELPCPTPPS